MSSITLAKTLSHIVCSFSNIRLIVTLILLRTVHVVKKDNQARTHLKYKEMGDALVDVILFYYSAKLYTERRIAVCVCVIVLPRGYTMQNLSKADRKSSQIEF